MLPETQHLGETGAQALTGTSRPLALARPQASPRGALVPARAEGVFPARTVGALFPGQGFQEATWQTTRGGVGGTPHGRSQAQRPE